MKSKAQKADNIEFEIANNQIDGDRDYQEDAYMANLLTDSVSGQPCAILIMADGMGGHAAGNIASNIAVATFNKLFDASLPTKDVVASLVNALKGANDQIQASVKETPALKGMGCTMVCAYLEGDDLYWVSVGDSHLYLIRHKELTKQNADHSYGGYLDMMKEQGLEVSEQIGMSRNMLMSAMTGEEISRIDVSEKPVKVRPGDRIIVASDGLDSITTDEITKLSAKPNAKSFVDGLLKSVVDAGRNNQDNTTVIVVDVKQKKIEIKPAASDPKFIHEERPPRSYKGLVWGFVIIAVIGLGYFGWQQTSMIEVKQATDQLLGSPAKVTPTPEPVIAPPISAENKGKDDSFSDEPKPEIKPKAKPQKIVKAVPFTDKLAVGGSGPLMIQVPSGTFKMGSPTGILSADEAPQHSVQVNSFMVSVHEVTYDEYDRFTQATRSKRLNSDEVNRQSYPVNNVSWDDALSYVRWLSKQTGKRYRLLSEAEWEYAARGGTTKSYWWGPSAGEGNAHCFNCKSSLNTDKPAKVGSYQPNPFGLLDVLGNVSEWVHDCYHRNYKNAPSDGSVWEGGDCKVRVARGGSYRSPASSIRVEDRDKFSSDRGHYNVGIRIARDI